MTHGGWQGSGEAGPGPRSSPQQMPARPSLPSPAKPARSPGAAGAPSASAGPERPGVGRRLPPGPRHPRPARPPLLPPPPAPRRLCGPGRAHSGKLLGPRRREGRKGGERRRRGPGGQQPGPPGSEKRVKPVNPVCHFPVDFRGEVLHDAPRKTFFSFATANGDEKQLSLQDQSSSPLAARRRPPPPELLILRL
ncbi:unnamed protein product [Rangifer tarandus platyrhynchus]|uniref:Uncharacterized protein n=1 Tax=Rangifer tarandus platyrhynchus TaxID=3082113 RepID=A0AC60A937_RANTA